MSSLQPGDSVLFRRGDVFYGRIQVTVSGQAGRPIVFAAYGSGAEPVIDGSVRLTNWESGDRPHQWQTTCDECETMPALYRGDRSLPLGRFPNRDADHGGYLTIQQGVGKNRFTGSDLPTGVSWVGAEAVVRSSRWTLDRATVSQQSGNTITLAENTTYTIPNRFGFFLQNHPAALDQAGEWSYEPARHRVTWFTTQANPQRVILYAAYYPYVLEIRGKEYIHVNQLAFRRARLSNVYLWGGQHIALQSIRSTQGATDGVQVFNCQHTSIVHSILDQHANNGLVVKNSEAITVRDNTLTATGTVAGMGSSGDGAYNAIAVTGNNIDVLHNTITQTGYVGIDFRGTNITVSNNTVSHFCTVKDDGAGIYTWTRPQQRLEGLRVSGNIVLHGGGGEVGTDYPEKSLAEGIYLDDRTHNVEVDYNTVAYCGGSGIYVHNSRRVSLHHNTLFDNQVPIKMISNGGAAQRQEMQIRDCQINNNVLVELNREQPLVELISMEQDVARFGTFDQNQYVHPFRTYGNFRVTQQLGTPERYDRHFSLRSWQQWADQDALSTLSPRYYRAFRVIKELGGNLFANADFDSTITEWTTWARYGNAQAQWHKDGHQNQGSLRVGFSSLSGQRDSKLLLSGQHGELPIQAGTHYRLRLSLKGDQDDQPLKLMLRKSGGDRSELAPSRVLHTTTKWHTYELIFSAEASSNTARLDLQLTEDDGHVWIDDVSLQPVVVQFSNPSDSVRLVYNPEKEKMDASLTVPRIGTNRRRYTGSAQVPPYRSLALLRTPGILSEPDLSDKQEPTSDDEPEEELASNERVDDSEGEEGQESQEEQPSAEEDVIAEEVLSEEEKKASAPIPPEEEIITGLADDEPTANSLLQLYPNPAHQWVTLRYVAEGTSETRIMISDARGQVVYQKAEVQQGNVQTTLPISSLPQGWYTVRVATGHQVYHSKLVVQ